jgi:hypothetical protein
MNLVFRYFYLLLLVMMAANVVIYRSRLRALEADGGISRGEADRLLRAGAAWFGGLFLLLAVIQLAAGWPSPFCLHARPLADPFVLASLGVALISYALLGWWIFARGGAELLSRASPVLGRFGARGRGWSPGAARIFTVVLLVGGIVGLIVPRLMPDPLPCEAPVAPDPSGAGPLPANEEFAAPKT